MNSIAEDAAEAPTPRAGVNWSNVIAIVVAFISLAVAGLVGYGHDQSDLRVKNAVTGATAVTQQELQPFRDADKTMSVDIGVLQSQRTEDRDRLIRIEEKLDKALSGPYRLPSRTSIPQVQAQRPQ